MVRTPPPEHRCQDAGNSDDADEHQADEWNGRGLLASGSGDKSWDCPRKEDSEAQDGKDLEKRLLGLPGFGEMKVKALIAVLGKRFGVRPPGYDDVAPTWPTLGDVDSAESLATYQAGKRAKKAADRATKD